MTILTRSLAAGSLAVCLVLTAAVFGSTLLPEMRTAPNRPSPLDVIAFATIFLAFPAVGTLVAWKRPSSPIGWLLVLIGVSFTAGAAASEYAVIAGHTGADLPGVPVAAWFGGSAWLLAFGIAIPLVLLLFPDGRLPGGRWRPFVRAGMLLNAALLIIASLAPGPLPDTTGILNPIGVDGPLGQLAVALIPMVNVTLLLVGMLAIGGMVSKLRMSRGVVRQQFKWLLYPAAVLVGALVVGNAVNDRSSISWTIALLGFGGIAVGTGVAVLRYRLYEIDVVIRRTLVYGAVVAILAVVYGGLVLTLQTALAEVIGRGPFPVAVSTLVIAALFGPVRARVRAAVDRRFYRSRYDAQRTVEAFASRLRDEVELEGVGRALVAVAGQAVRPTSVGIWLRPLP